MRPRRTRKTRARQQLDLLMRLTAHTNWFKSQPRLIHSLGPRRNGQSRAERSRQEHDGEHSFQIAFTGWATVLQFQLPLDPHKVLIYGLLHDFMNEWRYGDTPAFVKNGNGHAETPCRKTKAALEKKSRERFRRGLGKDMPFLMEWADAYEAQADAESRFIYALDKLIADINILQDAGHTNMILGADLPSVDLYKRQRIERDPTVLEWYEELFRIWQANERFLFPSHN